MPIRFDSERHLYITDDGREYSGITSILRRAGLLPELPPPQSALDRGSRVHQAIAFDLDGDLDERDEWAQSEEMGYVRAARAAVRELGLDIPKGNAEQLVVNELYGYGTAIDAVGRWHGKPCIINWKSSFTVLPHYPIQLALEALCVKEPVQRLGIGLQADGKWKLNECKDIKDFVIARAAITISNYRKENSHDAD